MISDFDEIYFEYECNEDETERKLIVKGPAMTDVEFLASLRTFCNDAENNICEDGETIIFDADGGQELH